MHPFLLLRSLRLVPVVLEPDLHLGGGQVDYAGEMLSLWRRQVSLLSETSLQLVGLCLESKIQFMLYVCVIGSILIFKHTFVSWKTKT